MSIKTFVTASAIALAALAGSFGAANANGMSKSAGFAKSMALGKSAAFGKSMHMGKSIVIGKGVALNSGLLISRHGYFRHGPRLGIVVGSLSPDCSIFYDRWLATGDYYWQGKFYQCKYASRW